MQVLSLIGGQIVRVHAACPVYCCCVHCDRRGGKRILDTRSSTAEVFLHPLNRDMSDINTNWPAALEHLSRPATLLIEKISAAIGVLYQPRHIRQIAQAEADAALITAKGEIAVDDLHRRALVRWVHEEAQKQANIEDIAERTVPLLEHNATPEQIDDDWLRMLFEKARHISNPDMQALWARVLARQANRSGAISIHALHTLALMDQNDAQYFMRACQLVAHIDDKPYMIVMNDRSSFVLSGGTTWTEFRRLAELGLIRIPGTFSFHTTTLPDPFTIRYGGKCGQMKFTQFNNMTAITGYIELTSIGWQLFSAIPVEPLPGFWPHLRERWTNQSHLEIVSWDD